MRIGDVATTLGISRDTVRRLERAGVIVPRPLRRSFASSASNKGTALTFAYT